MTCLFSRKICSLKGKTVILSYCLCMYPIIWGYLFRHLSLHIVLMDSNPFILSQRSCSCVAGTALCKYATALLFQATL